MYVCLIGVFVCVCVSLGFLCVCVSLGSSVCVYHEGVCVSMPIWVCLCVCVSHQGVSIGDT